MIPFFSGFSSLWPCWIFSFIFIYFHLFSFIFIYFHWFSFPKVGEGVLDWHDNSIGGWKRKRDRRQNIQNGGWWLRWWRSGFTLIVTVARVDWPLAALRSAAQYRPDWATVVGFMAAGWGLKSWAQHLFQIKTATLPRVGFFFWG